MKMSVYEQLTSQPNRKCRSETLLRLLISTSYPQSILTDLTFEFIKYGGDNSPEELERVANDMREAERNFDMFDFIRCIEIKRNEGQVQLQVKRLDFDPTMRTLEDNVNTHEPLANCNVQLRSDDTVLSDVNALATKLLETFYRSQVKARKNGNDISNTVWKSRTTHYDRRNPKAEKKVIEGELDFQGALGMLSASLRKRRFHIILTQNTILLLDQKSRIWGVSKA